MSRFSAAAALLWLVISPVTSFAQTACQQRCLTSCSAKGTTCLSKCETRCNVFGTAKRGQP
jgi:hypothetical protein